MRFSYPLEGIGFTLDQNGKLLPSTTVSLYLTGTTTPAKMYAALSGGVDVYSITSDSITGKYVFYVDDGDYATSQGFDIVYTNTSYGANTFDPTTISNVRIMSPISTSGMLEGGTQLVSDTTGTIAIDWNVAATAYCTLTGTGRTITFTNQVAGQVYRLILLQGTGGFMITTWPTITWMGGSGAPTLSSSANKADILTFLVCGGITYGDCRNA
jgi:hypothetical protein